MERDSQFVEEGGERELTRLEKTNEVVKTLQEAITHAQEDELTGVLIVLNSNTHACISCTGKASEVIGDTFIHLIKMIGDMGEAQRKRQSGGIEGLMSAILSSGAKVMTASELIREMEEDDAPDSTKKGGKNVN